jgi:electron transfer flavoprotein alpha subunit
LQASTLVVGEHEKGALNAATLNAVAAATSLGEGGSVSVLLGGYGPSVHEAAKQAASCHSGVSQVL